MPFQAMMPAGGAGSSGEPSGMIGAGLPAATMHVAPDQILTLKTRLEDIRYEVSEFLAANRRVLSRVPPPGLDPCSEETAGLLGENGASAIAAADGYVAELTAVIDALAESARSYGLVEEANTDAFRGTLS